MKSKTVSLNPAALALLEEARREFKRWRHARTNRSRVPENLWSLAANVARECGVSQTARALHLNPRRLRNRLKPSETRFGRKELAPAGFVELMAAPGVRFSECTVEIARGKGTRVTIHLKSPEVPDLGAISNAILMVRR